MIQSLFSDYLVPFALAVTMLGMGLSLETNEFRRVFYYPKAIITGILTKLIFLPGIAFLISICTDISLEFKIGLILIAACPGGATTNLLTYLLRGNLALSISMTAINSLIVLISLPFTINLSLIYFYGISKEIHLPLFQTIFNIFALTIIPTVIGIYIRKKKINLAISLEKPLRYLLPSLLLLVFAGVIILEQNQDATSFRSALVLFPLGLLLNFFGMGLGKYIAKMVRLSRKTQFTIAIEVGLQNSALAIFIASTILENQKMALVAVIYSSFSFFSTALFGYLAKKYIP